MTSASVTSLPKLCPGCGSRYPVDALYCPADGSLLQSASSSSGTDVDPYVGREILGHIGIKQLAGIGAMGRVYRAFQKGIDRDVAIKILHRELSANQQLVSRFHREAKVASRLQHANVVHVYLTGQLPDGSMYIVMEYLDGMSLQSALAASGGAMPLVRALHIALQLSDATGEAHAQGIVHRDIKPENVMLVRRGDDDDYVKVLDFGIARLNWGEQSMATAAGLIFGTARYISPEGAQGEQVGPTGDVYSIATMLYQMLSGRTPFESDSAVGLLVQQIHDPPPPLRSIPRAAYVPEPITSLIMRNLSKTPADRESDGRVFGRALLEAARSAGLSADDLLARPTLLAARGAAPLHVQSIQRTRQLQLDRETAEQIASAGASSSRTSFEPPSRMSSRPPEIDPYSVAPGAATTKWTPPPGFGARLAPPASFPPPRSRVDATLDDETPAPTGPASSAPRRAAAPASASGASTRYLEDGDRRPSAPPARHSSRAPVSDSMHGEDEDGHRVVHRGRRTRAVMIVLLCFLLGVAGAALAAYKLGLIGPSAVAQGPTRDALLAKANEARRHQQWDAPPGDNVVELTTEGLQRWPNDQDILDVRAQSCDAIVRIARGKKKDGDIMEAVRLVKLAHALDATDDDATDLTREYQKELDNARLAPVTAAHDAGVPLHLAPKPTASAPPPTAVNAVFDVSTQRPRVGQPVELSGRILIVPSTAARPKVEDVAFIVVGPGLGGGVRLGGLVDDAGAFHAQYTFLEPGKFEVVFAAKANGSARRATRGIVVGAVSQEAPAAPQPPAILPTPTASSEPLPAPMPPGSATGKWL